VINGTSAQSQTLNCVFGGACDLIVQPGVVPGNYNNVTCLPSGTINAYGIFTVTNCFDASGFGGNGGNITNILAVAHETTVSITNGTATVGTVQPIDVTSSPTFAGATLTGATANTFAFFGASKQFQSGALPDGTIWVGATGSLPSAIIPTTANGRCAGLVLLFSRPFP